MFLPPHTHTHSHSHRHSITMPASYRSLILGHSTLPTALPIQEESLRVSPIVPTGPQLQAPAELVKMELSNLQDKMIDRGMSVFLSIHPPLTCSSLPSHAPPSPHMLLTPPHMLLTPPHMLLPPLTCSLLPSHAPSSPHMLLPPLTCSSLNRMEVVTYTREGEGGQLKKCLHYIPHQQNEVLQGRTQGIGSDLCMYSSKAFTTSSVCNPQELDIVTCSDVM